MAGTSLDCTGPGQLYHLEKVSQSTGGSVSSSPLLPFPSPGSEEKRETRRNGWAWLGLERRAALRAGRFVSGGLQASHTIPVTSTAVALKQIAQRMRSGRGVWAVREPWAHWLELEEYYPPHTPLQMRL